jgi:DNA polymerase-1
VNRRPPRNGEKQVKKTNTLLIDGNALFKFSFLGAKNEYNQNGEHIGGLYSFLVIMRKLLNEDLYHKVFVFWDGKFSGKLRYEIYKPYKSSRGKDYENGTHPVDEIELEQRKKIWDYLNALNVRQIKHEVVESDDFIGYYCLNKAENEQITIASTDRDFLQLISNDIKIYFLDLREYIDIRNYFSYFCYIQENAMLLKVILGDNSDTIKGIKGVRDKTLLKLIPELTEKKLSIDEVIELASNKQNQRINENKKPLKALYNIINKVTDGVQKENIYEINEKLVNLKKPMITEDAIAEINNLINGSFDFTDYSLKNVMTYMKRDGLDKAMGQARYEDFLIPFKKLINREVNIINN